MIKTLYLYSSFVTEDTDLGPVRESDIPTCCCECRNQRSATLTEEINRKGEGAERGREIEGEGGREK